MEITLNDGSVEMFVVVGDMLGDSSNGELLAAIDSASARVESGEAVRYDIRVR
jgi:hypothetical protein